MIKLHIWDRSKQWNVTRILHSRAFRLQTETASVTHGRVQHGHENRAINLAGGDRCLFLSISRWLRIVGITRNVFERYHGNPISVLLHSCFQCFLLGLRTDISICPIWVAGFKIQPSLMTSSYYVWFTFQFLLLFEQYVLVAVIPY